MAPPSRDTGLHADSCRTGRLEHLHGNLHRELTRCKTSPASHLPDVFAQTAQPSVGELRLIARLSRSAVPNSMTGADIKGGTAIEGSDGTKPTLHITVVSADYSCSVYGQRADAQQVLLQHSPHRGPSPRRDRLWHRRIHGHPGNGLRAFLRWPLLPRYCRSQFLIQIFSNFH